MSESLDRLAEPHIIRQDASNALFFDKLQPGQACALIWSEVCKKSSRLLIGLFVDLAQVFKPVEQAAQMLGHHPLMIALIAAHYASNFLSFCD